MNTIENNKLIAKFLGYKEHVNEGAIQLYIKDKVVESMGQLDFHKDWNWLMEVVEKIESLKPIEFLSGRNWIGFDVRIYKTFNTQTNYCTIKYLKESGDMTVSNGFSKKNKIESVYNACVEFIKWYNENK